jgi:hypothetical protein
MVSRARIRLARWCRVIVGLEVADEHGGRLAALSLTCSNVEHLTTAFTDPL